MISHFYVLPLSEVTILAVCSCRNVDFKCFMIILKVVLHFEAGPVYCLGINIKKSLLLSWISLPVVPGNSQLWKLKLQSSTTDRAV